MIRKILILFLLFANFTISETFADQTSGGVTWIDTVTGYTKPAFYPITVPSETTSTKYYVDMTSGNDSNNGTSSSTPCKTINGLAAKGYSSLQGGPAYVYLKGSGNLQITGTFYGAAGNEIVVKPWVGDSTLVNMPTDGSGNVSGANTIFGANVHDLIIDGGPLLQFDFNGVTSPSGSQNGYVLNASSNHIKIARSRIHNPNGWGPCAGTGTGSSTHSSYVYFINNEIYDNNNWNNAGYALYAGGGSGCNGNDTYFDHVYVLNNIVRNIYGQGLQFEPRNSASYIWVEGNAFHDIGTGFVGSAVQPASSCNGTITNITIDNNIMFNLGGGGVTLVGSFTSTLIYSNTIYNYGITTPATANSHGIGCYSDGCPATVENNIISLSAQPGTVLPLNRGSGFTETDNLCDTSGCNYNESGTNTFQSTTDTLASYLKIKSTSSAVGHGATVSGGNTSTYFGAIRSGTWDIGADAYATGGSAPIANFTGTPTSGSVPFSVTFTDSSTNAPTSWSWTFGDGGTSTSQNPIHSYTTAGTYTVALTATNAYGNNTYTATGYIVASGGGSQNIFFGGGGKTITWGSGGKPITFSQ